MFDTGGLYGGGWSGMPGGTITAEGSSEPLTGRREADGETTEAMLDEWLMRARARAYTAVPGAGGRDEVEQVRSAGDAAFGAISRGLEQVLAM
jgi:hypothetical protein